MSDQPDSRAIHPLSGIDPLIHAPARLMLLTQLYVVEAADATFLVKQTGLSWGNYSTHMAKLEQGGYVEVEKSFRGTKPLTMIRLTDSGRRAFQEYRASMQRALGQLPE